MKSFLVLSATLALATSVQGWVSVSPNTQKEIMRMPTSTSLSAGALHGESASFLPLEQCDNEYYAPRVVQIAGMYPGVTKEEIMAVSSTPSAELGQWSYDFSDPDGPQMGTVAVPGTPITTDCEDPVVIIAEHFSLGVPLPEVLTEPVDLLVLMDRAEKGFAERKFLVVDVPGEGVLIKAFSTKAEIPVGSEVLGRVTYVQIPWLPCMKKKKSGFMEDDQLY